MDLLPPKHLTEGLLPEGKHSEFWRLIDIQGLRPFLFTTGRYYPRMVAAAYATLSIRDNLNENGADEFYLYFRLRGVEYALSLDGLAAAWGFRYEGTTFKGGNGLHSTWGEFQRLEAMQELRLGFASSGKFAVSRMTMDQRLLLYVISYVVLLRKISSSYGP
ncbi:hypothetical protein PIB30_078955 [Stylosanthes scabra]|uniref:Uncharacterized protein n=1 Tax=Stylosanthes scabra TaxID=79078 RepID=A0ABU6XP05_9FABA|nr:hypothetical protein [Stylosanthes scabra]